MAKVGNFDPAHAAPAGERLEAGNILGGLHRYTGATQQHVAQGHRKMPGIGPTLRINKRGRKSALQNLP